MVDALLELFPQAEIFTNIFDKRVFSHLAENHAVNVSFIDRLPMAKRSRRLLCPVNAAGPGSSLISLNMTLSSAVNPGRLKT